MSHVEERSKPTRRCGLGPWVGLLAALILSSTSAAWARERGLAGGGCEGCHGNSDDSEISISPLNAALGEQAVLHFTITDPNAEVAGIFIESEDLASVSVSSGSDLAVVSNGITHTWPRDFSGGQVSFDVTYRVPDTPGATRFSVWTLAGNGDGRNDGDEGNSDYFELVYGCNAQTFYRDLDGDGYGRSTSPRRDCEGSPPDGHAALGDDCDDNSTERFPGAIEYCNRRDDDCDGEVDEGALPVLLFPDSDGDGFYSFEEGQSDDTVMGCIPYPGYADQPGDCNPDAPEVNPGTEEVCDMYLDEDCDGRVDERVRPICGEGWCRRESLTCSLDDCTPGEPVEESCNFLDDDCDGDVDEGQLCPAGQSCLAGECRNAPSGSPDGPASSAGSPKAGVSGCSSAAGAPPSGWLAFLVGVLCALTATRRRRAWLDFDRPRQQPLKRARERSRV